jgi:hypothetical protein
MSTSWISLACRGACLVVSFVVVFMLAGAVAPVASTHWVGQLVLAAIAALVGLLSGNFVYQRFFPGR